MNVTGFEQLCRDASRNLGVRNEEALGRGCGMWFGNVHFQTSFCEDRARCLLAADLGGVTAADRQSVYEHLLTAQLMTWNRPAWRFGFDPNRKSVVLCVEIDVRDRVDSDRLATLIRRIAAQAVEWQGTLMTGNLP